MGCLLTDSPWLWQGAAGAPGVFAWPWPCLAAPAPLEGEQHLGPPSAGVGRHCLAPRRDCALAAQGGELGTVGVGEECGGRIGGRWGGGEV